MVSRWDPSQNSVEPFAGEKSERGKFAMKKNGHWALLEGVAATVVRIDGDMTD